MSPPPLIGHVRRTLSGASISSATGRGPQGAYDEGLKKGIYRADPRQVLTVRKLQAVHDAVAEHISKPRLGRRRPSSLTMVDSMHGGGGAGGGAAASSLWSSLMGGAKSSRGSGGGAEGPAHQEPLVKGLYMYGGVGCGKTVRHPTPRP